ncbi:beta-lactamase-like protein [Aspergillus spinulosporus]
MVELPSSANTVSVSVIDPGVRLDLPASWFVVPHIKGHDRLIVPSYSFLISHPSGQKILFDLSVRSDFENLAPAVAQRLTDPTNPAKVTFAGDVSKVLVKNGVPLDEIDAIIWSHSHFDHTGNPSLFPRSTALVVGPGFTTNHAPGYPEKLDSPVLLSDWQGRKLQEIDFDNHPNGTLSIGKFKAIDYFGDGSFYLLHTPGHTPDHMCGLARVRPDSFVLMGGDFAHHPGEFRPTELNPIPDIVRPNPLPRNPRYASICPGDIFESLGHQPGNTCTPFYRPAEEFNYDMDQCNATIEGLGEFDESDDVLVVIAHDHSLLPIFTGEEDGDQGWLFPKRSLDSWKEADLKNRGMWRFLGDFEDAVADV